VAFLAQDYFYYKQESMPNSLVWTHLLGSHDSGAPHKPIGGRQ
jgi:hypothetical protein